MLKYYASRYVLPKRYDVKLFYYNIIDLMKGQYVDQFVQ